MSVWYHYNVKAIAVDKHAVARFFNVDVENVYTEDFEFSFGGKNGACVRLDEIVKKNPDIIFLVEQQIECDTSNEWIERFDNITNEHQHIFLYTTGYVTTEINKQVMEEYDKAFPTLVQKHLANEKGYEGFRWSMFFNDFGRAAYMLRHAKDYEEMVTPISNDDFVDNDFSHLERDDD